ncbi:ASCH domain-containing protein [Algibacter sp.]|uniref:ASCH domain-containing protein n=1 Tax=Algibacter sp. TaxID=1872428 RepID=UPI003C77C995
MRKPTLIVFLFLITKLAFGQGDENSLNGIDKTVYDMWNCFTASNPEYKTNELPDSDFFHNNEADANRLAKLIINGEKKASSGLYAWYKAANADLPKTGKLLIVTDFHGKAQAIIKTKKVDTIPFNKISSAYAALDMGTNIEPLEKWKKAHWVFFASAMEQNGEQPTKNMLIVCENFETIWTSKCTINE